MFRSIQDLAPIYIDDVFINSREIDGSTDVIACLPHVWDVLALTRGHHLYKLVMRKYSQPSKYHFFVASYVKTAYATV